MSNQVFISYCRENKDFALKLIDDLRKRGINVWFDANIRGGEAWADKIEDAVESSVVVLVILSPESVESREVGNEIAYSLSKQKRIIPIMLANCQTPLRLASLNRQDFRGEYHSALNKLVDDILGNPMDIEIEPIKKKGYQKPVWILLIIGVLTASIVAFVLSRNSTHKPVILPKVDSTISKTDTASTDTLKPLLGESRSSKYIGTIGLQKAQMTIISQDGSDEITGTYFFTETPNVQFSFTGTQKGDVMELRQLPGARVKFKMIKSTNNCLAGSQTTISTGKVLNVNICVQLKRYNKDALGPVSIRKIN